MTYAVTEDEGEFVPNRPNPYCDKVSDEYMRNGGTCYDRYDTSDDTGLASCNDGSQREDPEDCPDATED
jgi:hypothetical protein